MQVPKWDRTRCPEEQASSVGMPHPLQIVHGNLTQLGKKSNSVIRSRSVNSFLDISLPEKLIGKSYRPQNKTFIRGASPCVSDEL